MNLANSRAHWRTKHKAKKAYWERCDNLQFTPGFPSPPRGGPLKHVTIAHTWYVGNLMDPDNAYARLKWPIDFLRTRGYIVEDRASNVTLLSPIQHIDRKNPRLTLELTETPTPG